MTESLLFLALAVISLAGVVLAALQLPGTWLVLAAAAGYDWYFAWQRIGWQWLVALVVVAGLAELLEMAASVHFARRAGAGRRASVGALVGGVLGMILLLVPLPLIGTIIGGLIGCFLGAFLAEFTRADHSASAAGGVEGRLLAGGRVGFFATVGRLVGLIARMAAAVVIAGAVVVAGWR